MLNPPVARQQVRRVGLIGGMSWRSTALYYERLNRAVESRRGPHCSFEGQVWNLDYSELLALVSDENWLGVEKRLVDAASGLARAGCEVVALTAVTAHQWHDAVSAAGAYLVPHVLDAAAGRLDDLNIDKVGILGTGTTCGSDFVRQRLGGRGRESIFLDVDGQARVDHLIQTILTASDDTAPGRTLLREAIRQLRSRGAEAIVLACTELPLLLPLFDIDVPIIDCVALHIDDICNHILSDTRER